ncbi:hypothetical protein Trydic_g10033, partial [Trypoxylus dichotomus]
MRNLRNCLILINSPLQNAYIDWEWFTSEPGNWVQYELRERDIEKNES